METVETVSGFGLIIVGNEILDGRVKDLHFATAQKLLRERGLDLSYVQILPDDPEVIDVQLRWASARPQPYFCCGGIGSTPDDYTRGCAARVAGVPLEYHPEGLAILREKLGKDLNEGRKRLVEFPKGCVLIPNPFNRVPGFRMGNGHFLPGFPEMAAPMMAWILDTWYGRGAEKAVRTLLLPGAREGDLVGMMDRFVVAHPSLTFSSLPRFVGNGTEVRLGISGPPAAVEAGLRDLTAALSQAGANYQLV
jgi:molybdopterin-biosynthesis enzyme MoeA-like protein